MHAKKIKQHLLSLDLVDVNVPPAIILLQALYGLTQADISVAINRSPNQMSYYRNGTTPVPANIQARLRRLLEDALRVNRTITPENRDTEELLEAIASMTERILEAM